MLKFKRSHLATVHDAVMAAVSFILSIYIRLGSDRLELASTYFVQGTILFTVISVGMFIYMRLYRGLWRYFSIPDMIVIVKAVTLSILTFAIVMFTLNRMGTFPRSVFFINWMLLIFMIGAPRFIYRAIKDRTLSWHMAVTSERKIPVLLLGAGDEAEQFIRDTGRDAKAPF